MTKYFKESEFTCKCGCNTNEMNAFTVAKLDRARGIAGVPFVITSGYRCEAHNRAVGGVKGSAHTKGYAVDIKADTGALRYTILMALLAVGFNRIGIAKTFIHVDDDPTLPKKVIWDY